MKTKVVKSLMFVCLITALVAVISAYPLCGNVAQAASYGGSEFEDLWYYGEGALDIGAAKTVVDGWDKSRLSQKIIAVIDTGIDASHELFDGVLYKDKNGNEIGYNSRTDKVEPVANLKDNSTDGKGKPAKHGTSVAGVIAMLIKEFGLENYISILPIKADERNSKGQYTISVDATVKGIKYAQSIGADAVNMSFGLRKNSEDGDGTIWSEDATDKSLVNAIYSAADSVFIVAAAGNNGSDSAVANNIFYPAGQAAVYSVMGYGAAVSGSSGEYNKNVLTASSNYGKVYDVAAPGVDVYTAFSADGNTYHNMLGSSLATPIATFAGVLLKLRYEAESDTPLSGAYVTSYMRNLDLRTVKKENYDIKCLDLKTVVTQNFEETPFDYVPPKGIELVHNGTYGKDKYKDDIVMHATSVSELEFTAKLSPHGQVDPDLYSSIEWVLRKEIGKSEIEETPIYEETHLGYGAKLNYTPKVFGKTIVVAILHGEDDKTFEAEQSLYIEYGPYLVGEVRVTYAQNVNDDVDVAPSSGVLYTTETTVFGLTGIQFVDKSVTIKWYVDGVLVDEGETFAYTPTKSGKHRISAQYGDNPRINTTFVFVADVKVALARPLYLTLFLIGLAALIGATVAIVVKKKKANKPVEAAAGTEAVAGTEVLASAETAAESTESNTETQDTA
ncbi:MAG: S8 family serine peptidase, partial [Clostridia bacterium]|nr:S8 family serine peptidase [Clostridia bacterium]